MVLSSSSRSKNIFKCLIEGSEHWSSFSIINKEYLEALNLKGILLPFQSSGRVSDSLIQKDSMLDIVKHQINSLRTFMIANTFFCCIKLTLSVGLGLAFLRMSQLKLLWSLCFLFILGFGPSLLFFFRKFWGVL